MCLYSIILFSCAHITRSVFTLTWHVLICMPVRIFSPTCVLIEYINISPSRPTDVIDVTLSPQVPHRAAPVRASVALEKAAVDLQKKNDTYQLLSDEDDDVQPLQVQPKVRGDSGSYA